MYCARLSVFYPIMSYPLHISLPYISTYVPCVPIHLGLSHLSLPLDLSLMPSGPKRKQHAFELVLFHPLPCVSLGMIVDDVCCLPCHINTSNCLVAFIIVSYFLRDFCKRDISPPKHSPLPKVLATSLVCLASSPHGKASFGEGNTNERSAGHDGTRNSDKARARP